MHWSVKLVHIDILQNLVQANPSEAFHTAMHFSNLLSVSEHLPVREHAGAALLQLVPYLTVDQRNEIVVDLTGSWRRGRSRFPTTFRPS